MGPPLHTRINHAPATDRNTFPKSPCPASLPDRRLSASKACPSVGRLHRGMSARFRPATARWKRKRGQPPFSSPTRSFPRLRTCDVTIDSVRVCASPVARKVAVPFSLSLASVLGRIASLRETSATFPARRFPRCPPMSSLRLIPTDQRPRKFFRKSSSDSSLSGLGFRTLETRASIADGKKSRIARSLAGSSASA